MSIIAITEQGSTIKKQSRRIFIEKDEKILMEIKAEELTGIITFGNINFTNQAISLLANSGIPLTYLSYDGKPKGQFLPMADKNKDLRFMQYNLFNSDKAFHFAKSFTLSKLYNSGKFIKDISKSKKKDELKLFFETNKSFIEKIERCSNYNELLGYEGASAKNYFDTYSKFFKKEIKFSNRTKRPPKDEANALLSFGYVLMNNIITSLCYGSGLDPYVGFLHKNHYNRASLSADLTEIFRARIVDRLVLKLCNKGIIKKKDFVYENNGYFLNKEGLSKFLEQWMKTIYEAKKGKTLISLITNEINILIKSIREESVPVLGGF